MKFERFVRDAIAFATEKSIERHSACPEDYEVDTADYIASAITHNSSPIRRAYLATVRKVVFDNGDYRNNLIVFNSRHPSLTERLKIVLFYLHKLSVEDYLHDVVENQHIDATKPSEIEYRKMIFNEYPQVYYDSALRKFKQRVANIFSYYC